MKFAVDLSKGILGEADSSNLWTDIINQIPDTILLNPNVRILSVACGHCTEAIIIAKRMLSLGISKDVIQNSIWLIDKYNVFTNHAKLVYGFKNVITQDVLLWETTMKFDVILGNPPYQDGSKDGGQNKIYDPISKKALELLNDDGIIAFVTPTSVLKDSKRFSLVNQPGLKVVDFTANNHFNVGIQICWWMVDKKYSGDVTIKHGDGTITTQSNNNTIYDYSKIDKDFSVLYERLKLATNEPSNRMFMQNAVDTKTGRRLKADSVFQYPVYKIDNGNKKLVQYNKPKPKFYQKLKFIISMTKGFSDSAVVVDIDDYDVAHLCTEINNSLEVDNIKSFIFSDYFIKHSESWKSVDGYGYNYALKHLPPFDKSKPWTNNEVKEFIESYA